jgi:hypothetical protein
MKVQVEAWNQPAGYGNGWAPCHGKAEDAMWFVFVNGWRELRVFKNKVDAEKYAAEQRTR